MPQTSVVVVLLLVEVVDDDVEVEDVDVVDVEVVLSVVEVEELVEVVDVDSVVLVVEVDDVVVLVSEVLVVVDVAVVVELVEFVVLVVLGSGAHEQCAGRLLHAPMAAVSPALYLVSLSLLVDVGAVNREQNRSGELPNTTWTSTSPWGTASSPYVTPPFFFSLIFPARTCAVLRVTSSFHLYFVGGPLAGTWVHPGVTVGEADSVRHWQSVALKTTTDAPLAGGSSTAPKPGVNGIAGCFAKYWMLCAPGLLLRLLTCTLTRSPAAVVSNTMSAAIARAVRATASATARVMGASLVMIALNISC